VATVFEPARARETAPGGRERPVGPSLRRHLDPPGGPVSALTLEAAVEMALRRNPDLVAMRAREPAAFAAYEVADTYPFNPQIQSQVLPYTRDRDGRGAPVSQQHVLLQTFEIAGQQGFRSAEAKARVDVVRWTIERAELDVVARTERLFFVALYRRDLHEMFELLAELDEELVEVTRRRLDAGRATAADVAVARLQARSARRRQRLAEANYDTALMDLRMQLDEDGEPDLGLEGSLLERRWLPLEAALSAAPAAASETAPALAASDLPSIEGDRLRGRIAGLPEVIAARAAVAAAREGLALADAMRVPNVQIGPMWQRDDASTQFWGVQAQVDIPVVDTGAALVRQRAAELRLQQIAAAQVERKALLDAITARRRYERLRALTEQSQRDFPRPVPVALRPFEGAFEAGRMTLLQVFSAHASLLQSRQTMLDLLRELALAATEVTRTTGLRVSDLSQLVPPSGREPARGPAS